MTNNTGLKMTASVWLVPNCNSYTEQLYGSIMCEGDQICRSNCQFEVKLIMIQLQPTQSWSIPQYLHKRVSSTLVPFLPPQLLLFFSSCYSSKELYAQVVTFFVFVLAGMNPLQISSIFPGKTREVKCVRVTLFSPSEEV